MARGPALDDRRPALFAVGGAAVALASIALAAAAGPPYLAIEALSPWIVTFAIGLFCALFAAPFVIHSRLGGTLEADARWERALLLWGALVGAVLLLAVLSGLATDFDPDSLGGSIALVAGTEAILVLATLLVWLLNG